MNLEEVKLYPVDDFDGSSPDWEGWYKTDDPDVFIECHETWDNIVYRDEEETDPCFGTVYYTLYEVGRWSNGHIACKRELDGGVMGYEEGDTMQDLQNFMIVAYQEYTICEKIDDELLCQRLDEAEDIYNY